MKFIRARHYLRLLFTALVAAPLTVGGQAVLEGVMMRSPRSFAVAVRRRDGSIVIKEESVNNFLSRFRIFRWPLIRGAIMLIESLLNGLSALNFAADQAMLDEEDPNSSKNSTPHVGASLIVSSPAPSPVASSQNNLAIWGTLAFAIVAGLALFVGLPHGLTYLLGLLIPGGLDIDSVWFHLVDGVFKLMIFIGYIMLISRLDDIKRLFMYHGAEHKAVHTFEAKRALVVEEARVFSTAHPRCGTSLILWVVAVSIFMFAAIFPFIPKFFEPALANHALAIVIKFFLTLPVAGLAYELQRFAAKHPNSVWVQRAILPGMKLQALTTREPGDPELEIALAALRKVLWREQLDEESQGADKELKSYADFEEFILKVA